MNEIFLKSGKEKALLRRHPWIFSGAIESISGAPENGSLVRVYSKKNEFLGVGSYSPHSQIRIRMWSFADEELNYDFFYRKISDAVKKRVTFINKYKDSAWRLVFAESDLIPGLIVDQYNDVLVVQILSSGAEYFRETIIKALTDVTGIGNIFERSDSEVRKLEGLPERSGVISGIVPDIVEIIEGGYRFLVDIVGSQKTGFYLDQRINRRIVTDYCSGKNVLNVFSFTGAFSIYAIGSGATKVVSMDSSQEAISLAKRNHILNGFAEEEHQWLEVDAFMGLRKLRDQNQKFDVIILDPPKFAPTASHVNRAARAYKDINLLALKLLNSGGILATFSCSGGVSDALFQKIVADAALDAGVEISLLEKLSQGPDHPINLFYPESAYLKGLICIKN
jgi:23S rRNA (cytosine1962-C5)-methyltransferase